MYPKFDFGVDIYYSTVFNMLNDMCCLGHITICMTMMIGKPVMKSLCNKKQNWGHSERMGNSKSKIVSGKLIKLFKITICINSRNRQRCNIWNGKIKEKKIYRNSEETFSNKTWSGKTWLCFIWILKIVYKLKVGNRNRHASG